MTFALATAGYICPAKVQQTVTINNEVVELSGTITEADTPLTGTIVDVEQLSGTITCEDSP